MTNYFPNFLIIGAAKAATTTLASMLSQHPQAGIVAGKEPHFFSMDEQYRKGWAWYQNCFSHCQGKLAAGDASTSYSRIRYYPDTVKRILFHIPEVKIIYMVRHPLDRIVSAYIERLVSVDASHAYPSVNHAVQAEPMMLDSSRYWEVFNHYRQFIDEARIKIVWFEEFTGNTVDTFHDICRFLDIDDTIIIQADERYQNSREQLLNTITDNSNGGSPVINTDWDTEVRTWVLNQLRDDNCRLLDYFGKPQDYWGALYR
jgi:hypothetical protein